MHAHTSRTALHHEAPPIEQARITFRSHTQTNHAGLSRQENAMYARIDWFAMRCYGIQFGDGILIRT